MSNEREQWGSKLGFIFAAAGSAVGIGNIWKFPSMAGEKAGHEWNTFCLCWDFEAWVYLGRRNRPFHRSDWGKGPF